MTLIGVGLRFTIISSIYAAVILTLHFPWMSHLSVPIPRVFTLIFGILLVIMYPHLFYICINNS